MFDPSSTVRLSNWVMLGFVFMAPSGCYWSSTSVIQLSRVVIMNTLLSIFKSPAKNELIFVSLFIFMMFINLMGLIPYGFSLSSHYSFNFSFGLTIWLSSMIWGYSMNITHNVAHLTPIGCPMFLIPLMVLVETVSVLIRPVTLSLRLMSNMMAGHMIITLICNAVYFSMPSLLSPWISLLNTGFLLFELGVVFIQTYVFTMLMNLYWSETSDHN